MSEHQLPPLPDDDADFTPDLARKIIAKYQELLRLRAQQPPSPENAVPSQAELAACMRDCWGLITANMAKEDFFAASAVAIQELLRIRAQCVPSREAALEAAALDFIAKVDRGEARSRKSYAAFKAALSFTSPECDDDES